MNRPSLIPLLLLVAALGSAPGCSRQVVRSASTPAIVGAWRSTVQFQTGAFASLKDLEFMYVFSAGGTMTESSNYDADPPVPPAYGVWTQAGPREFEATYEFYSTKAPAAVAEITGGGGWSPSGRGVLAERIKVSDDGQSFVSTIRYSAFDMHGTPVEGGGEADGHGRRIGF